MDDFFGKEGIFAKLFANTLEQMMEAELTDHLGYEPYEAEGRNSGNSRNGYYRKKVRTSEGDTGVRIPRDRNGEYEPKILRNYAANTNELKKIIGLYAKGMSTRDIQDTLHDLYGVELSPNRSAPSPTRSGRWSKRGRAGRWMPSIRLFPGRPAHQAATRRKNRKYRRLRRPGRGSGRSSGCTWTLDWRWTEGANFWLSVVTDLQARGVQDIFIASVDG